MRHCQVTSPVVAAAVAALWEPPGCICCPPPCWPATHPTARSSHSINRELLAADRGVAPGTALGSRMRVHRPRAAWSGTAKWPTVLRERGWVYARSHYAVTELCSVSQTYLLTISFSCATKATTLMFSDCIVAAGSYCFVCPVVTTSHGEREMHRRWSAGQGAGKKVTAGWW